VVVRLSLSKIPSAFLCNDLRCLPESISARRILVFYRHGKQALVSPPTAVLNGREAASSERGWNFREGRVE
jgi:hypothetical protein